MANLNQVTLVGRLTRDPELRWTSSGTPVATLGLAINHRYRQGDQWLDDVCYVECTVFGRQAESAQEYLSKGSPILVEGRLRWRSWEGSDGQKRSKHDVLASHVHFLSHHHGTPALAREPDQAFDDVPF